ncbi:MAG: Rieske 2Fe-2S domain-containing protein, partial [Deltaproteobacteria bacterium]|nr:Rieske 2Fe-2S domain-containing protein [Deltaproteobacteria bacterium]
MLTREDNEILTQVGPGTPMGELMRRYWVPVVLSSELETGGRTKRVRVLGESMVAFRTAQGEVGLLGEYCSHRRVSLYYGRVE